MPPPRLSLDPRDPDFYRDPYAVYRRIHALGGVFVWEQYGLLCFAGHAKVAALLRDRRFGRQILHVATREELGWPERPGHLAEFDAVERHSLLELEPPDHTRLRALVNRGFVSRRVDALGPRIAEIAEGLIDGFARNGEADLVAGYAAPIPVRVIAEWIGAPVEDCPLLLDWSHKMTAMYRLAPSLNDERAAAAAAREFSSYLRSLIAARRRSPRDDLLGDLIAAEGDRLHEDELVSTLVLLLNAGHEATVHALGNAIQTLLERGLGPTVARADPAALETAVEELLRFDAPLHLFTRFALSDVELAGVALRRGERIGLLLGAANRDPLSFADPDRLDLARRPNPHVAFGGGIHFCLGAPLARLEMRIALPILFRRAPDLRAAESPRWRDSYHFRGLESLDARWRA